MKNNLTIILGAVVITGAVYLLFNFSALNVSSYWGYAVLAAGLIALYFGYRFLMAYIGKGKSAGPPILYADLRAYENHVANGIVKLYYELPENDHVLFTIQTLEGEVLQTLYDDRQLAGTYPVECDTSSLEDGTYYYELKTSNYKNTKKLIVQNT